MSVSRLANMISAIKNASMSGKNVAEVPYSKMCESVAQVLKDGGFLNEVKVYKLKDSSFKVLKLEVGKDLNDENNTITDINIYKNFIVNK